MVAAAAAARRKRRGHPAHGAAGGRAVTPAPGAGGGGINPTPEVKLAATLGWFDNPPCALEREIMTAMLAAGDRAKARSPRKWCTAAAVPGSPEDVDDDELGAEEDAPSPLMEPLQGSPLTRSQGNPLLASADTAPLLLDPHGATAGARPAGFSLGVSMTSGFGASGYDAGMSTGGSLGEKPRAKIGKRAAMVYRRQSGGATLRSNNSRGGTDADMGARGFREPALTSFYTPYEKWAPEDFRRKSVRDRFDRGLLASSGTLSYGNLKTDSFVSDRAPRAHGQFNHDFRPWRRAARLAMAIWRMRTLVVHRIDMEIRAQHAVALVPRGGRLLAGLGRRSRDDDDDDAATDIHDTPADADAGTDTHTAAHVGGHARGLARRGRLGEEKTRGRTESLRRAPSSVTPLVGGGSATPTPRAEGGGDGVLVPTGAVGGPLTRTPRRIDDRTMSPTPTRAAGALRPCTAGPRGAAPADTPARLARSLNVSDEFASMLAAPSPLGTAATSMPHFSHTRALARKGHDTATFTPEGYDAADFLPRAAHAPSATKGKRCQLVVSSGADASGGPAPTPFGGKHPPGARAKSASRVKPLKKHPDAFGAGPPQPMSDYARRIIKGEEKGPLVHKRIEAAKNRSAVREKRAALLQDVAYRVTEGGVAPTKTLSRARLKFLSNRQARAAEQLPRAQPVAFDGEIVVGVTGKVTIVTVASPAASAASPMGSPAGRVSSGAAMSPVAAPERGAAGSATFVTQPQPQPQGDDTSAGAPARDLQRSPSATPDVSPILPLRKPTTRRTPLGPPSFTRRDTQPESMGTADRMESCVTIGGSSHGGGSVVLRDVSMASVTSIRQESVGLSRSGGNLKSYGTMSGSFRHVHAQEVMTRYNSMQALREQQLESTQELQLLRIAHARELKRTLPERERQKRAGLWAAAVGGFQFLNLAIALQRRRVMQVVVRTKLRAWVERFKFRKAKRERMLRMQPNFDATRPVAADLTQGCVVFKLWTSKGIESVVHSLVLEHCPRGEHLTFQGDPALRVRFLISGIVEYAVLTHRALTPAGRAEVRKARAVEKACTSNGRFAEGEVIDWSILAAGEETPRYVYSALCRSDAAMWSLPLGGYRKLLALQPKQVREQCERFGALYNAAMRPSAGITALTPAALKRALAIVREVEWEEEDLVTLCLDATPKYIPDRGRVFAEGEHGEDMYVIARGLAVLHRKPRQLDFAMPESDRDADDAYLLPVLRGTHIPDDDRFLGVLAPGEGFGDYACVPPENTDRTCGVVSLGGLFVWCIKKYDFQYLAHKTDQRRLQVQRTLYNVRVGRMPRTFLTKNFFESHSWLCGIDEKQAQAISEEAVPVLCSAGDVVAAAGQPLSFVLIAMSGLLLVNDPHVKSIRTDGTWRGLTLAVVEAQQWPFSLITPGPCEVWQIPSLLVQHVIQENQGELMPKLRQEAKAALAEANVRVARRMSRVR